MRNERTFDVFISAPSGVDRHVNSINGGISKANIALKKSNIKLNPIFWRSDAVSGVSSEPQALINRELVDESDIFLFLFHERLGTKTKSHESGTIEEFNIAYDSHKKEKIYKLGFILIDPL